MGIQSANAQQARTEEKAKEKLSQETSQAQQQYTGKVVKAAEQSAYQKKNLPTETSAEGVEDAFREMLGEAANPLTEDTLSVKQLEKEHAGHERKDQETAEKLKFESKQRTSQVIMAKRTEDITSAEKDALAISQEDYEKAVSVANDNLKKAEADADAEALKAQEK